MSQGLIQDNELTGRIIGAAIDVHKVLGPGLLESAYKECLYYKLFQTGLNVIKEKAMPVCLRRLFWNVDTE